MIVAKMELVSTITGTTTNVATVHIMTDHSWADGDLSQLTYRNMEGKWKDEVIVAEQGAGTGCELRMDVTGSYEELGFDTSYPNKLSYAVTASGSDGYDKSLLDEEGMSLVWDSTYLDVTLVPNTEANIAEKNMNSLKRASAMLAQLYNGRVLYEDIELPTSTYGVDTIEWKSTNSEYITDDGHVTRPDVDAIDDAYVTMIATFRKNDQLLKKEVDHSF